MECDGCRRDIQNNMFCGTLLDGKMEKDYVFIIKLD